MRCPLVLVPGNIAAMEQVSHSQQRRAACESQDRRRRTILADITTRFEPIARSCCGNGGVWPHEIGGNVGRMELRLICRSTNHDGITEESRGRQHLSINVA